MAKRIFKDAAHQQLFDRQGFIVLPFITAEEIRELNGLFDELHPDISGSGFFSGSYSSDFDYKKKVSDAIVRTFARAYAELFTDYTPFGGAFLYKVPGANSELAPHQDWTIVDEKENIALNCWVPLQDITPDNGPIMILPGSHYDNYNIIRAPTLPFFWQGHEDLVKKELLPMIVPAGTAVILNQSVIHYSPDNRSDKVRRAITAGVKSGGAQMHFHYRIPGQNQLEVFEMDDDFLISFRDFATDIGQRPYLGRSVGTIPYTLPQPAAAELGALLAHMKVSAGYTPAQRPSTPTGWLQRLRSLIGA
ncbi:MAG: phytanoyl-CoA dioxygenase family protein [Bacteroidetes bacterium]|nr:phytanoyl-CoA dioxygenase family protein [Bacteroidota bacterium]